MYLQHFGLKRHPFGLSPRIDFVYRSGAFEENMAHLVYGLDNREAITMITGPVGSGKTLAIHSFLDRLGNQFSTALVTNTQVNPVELLKLILEDLDVATPPGCDKSDLLILFKDFLLQEHISGRRVLIVIDEAQNLPLDALEEVRLLTNLGQGDHQPVQIVLVGQPELEDIINSPQLRQLRQRIRVHYQLAPLAPGEIEAYLNHRMEVAGCSRKIFDKHAIERIAEYSRGIPRLVNALANAALLSAFVAGRDAVKAKDVDPVEAGLPESVAGEGPQSAADAAPGHAAPPPPPEPETPAPPPSVSRQGKGTRPDTLPTPELPTVETPSPPASAGAGTPSAGQPERKRQPIGLVVVLVLILAPAILYFSGQLDGLIGRTGTEAAPAAAATEPANPPPAAENAGAETAPGEPADTPAGNDSATEASTGAPRDPGETPAVTGAPRDQGGTPAATAAQAQPDQASGDEQPAAAAATTIAVHVASFTDRGQAQRYAFVLRNRSYPTEVRTFVLDGQTWYRVCLGPYTDEDQARSDLERLKKEEGITYYQILRTDAR